MAVDVYSRRVMATPMKEKTAPDAVLAWQAIVDGDMPSGEPLTVDTDIGGEFEGAFDTLMHRLRILHMTKDPRQKDALAVVDSAIARLKDAISKELVDTGSESWVEALPRAVQALNARRNPNLLGSSADELMDNGILQYTMDKVAGEGIQHNEAVVTERVVALRNAGPTGCCYPGTSGHARTRQSTVVRSSKSGASSTPAL